MVRSERKKGLDFVRNRCKRVNVRISIFSPHRARDDLYRIAHFVQIVPQQSWVQQRNGMAWRWRYVGQRSAFALGMQRPWFGFQFGRFLAKHVLLLSIRSFFVTSRWPVLFVAVITEKYATLPQHRSPLRVKIQKSHANERQQSYLYCTAPSNLTD